MAVPSFARNRGSKDDLGVNYALLTAVSQESEDYSASQVVFSPVYLSRACSDRSRPNPDCLNPPNGVWALSASTVLTDTVPARSAAATRCARERSFVQTE